MAELLERLQQAIGDTYRIEKELGGGGMSRVFLAEEVELARRVVIKVLPPDMAAGVNKERFHREIQLAAKLQHPHVVPLLTAGASGDLLYYVMPFIQGESLRVKLAREGELPVSEALQILGEVVDALAYAHRNGVVHRDIKPDNVLLSEGHAVVTDFGVAKAVTASSGSSSLTSLGVALGTPAYMAPEQAAADPHTDHRADIYAVGALAYEMLCGRPPFSAPTPQAVMAAHVSEIPDPMTKHRSAVSEALNALVMRCLEKKAADRWQSASELVPQLKAMATPSGGVTPTGTQPVAAVSAEAAAQRSHPMRVAGLFGLGSIGALAVVYSLVQLLGLPDWVIFGAIVLLAIGLPITLVTGHHERQRALARTTGIAVATPAGGVQRWFTWRKALTGGGLAFAGLAVLAALYMAMRVLGIGPVGTLVAAGVLDERGMLVVADFEDRTGDSSLSTSVTEAFRIDLAQSPVVKLMDASTVGQVLERMNRDPGTRVNIDLAREIAEREGVKAIVAGDIGTLGRSYVVSVRLLSSMDGTELVALRESAEDDAALIGAVDRLSAKLRERIGESLITIRAGEPLERVTTASLEALQLYSRAERASQEGDPERAIRLLEDAVALDTAFAMAYRKLGVVLNNSGAGQSRVNAAVTRAFQHRDRLPPLERYLAIAYYYDQVEPDADRTIDAYRSVLEINPDDDIALNNLAIELNDRREWEEAESLLRHGVQIAPVYQMFVNLLVSQGRQGKWAEADSTLAEFEARMPDNPITAWSAAAVGASKHEYEQAAQILRDLSDEARGSPGLRRRTNGLLIPVEILQGKLASAEQVARAEMAAAEAEGNLGAALEEAAGLALYEMTYRENAETAVRRVQEALERYPIVTIPPPDRPYFPIARVYADAGQPNRAREMREEWERALPETQRPMAERYSWDGIIAMAEGRYRDAIDAYRSFYDQVGCNVCGLHELARAYDRAGNADSALAVYERAVSLPDAGSINWKSLSLASTYIRLGELYEERGNQAKATEYYSRLVELWENADPELQPVVQDVRNRIARLVGER